MKPKIHVLCHFPVPALAALSFPWRLPRIATDTEPLRVAAPPSHQASI
ncbi:uncharacterized protein AruCF_2443 [Achromobacter ruhlandii]|nr:uncharacterized protein AruCF_2443 [Achromobacter ruhlandii]